MGSGLIVWPEYRHPVISKLEQAFRYLSVKQRVEAYADKILGQRGLKSRLLPTLTTGVQGDHRTYGFVLMVEAPADTDLKSLPDLSSRLTNEIPEISRVVLSTASDLTKNETLVDDYFLNEKSL